MLFCQTRVTLGWHSRVVEGYYTIAKVGQKSQLIFQTITTFWMLFQTAFYINALIGNQPMISDYGALSPLIPTSKCWVLDSSAWFEYSAAIEQVKEIVCGISHWLGSGLSSENPELSLQCEQGSAQIFSAGLEFLIQAAGCSFPLVAIYLGPSRKGGPF